MSAAMGAVKTLSTLLKVSQTPSDGKIHQFSKIILSGVVSDAFAVTNAFIKASFSAAFSLAHLPYAI
jgi:hypothetical protein